MTMLRARTNPDGSLVVSGQVFRLSERAGHRFDVVRQADGACVGSFVLDGNDPPITIEANASAPEVVRAIVDLLSVPRGLLPLQ